MRGRIEKEKEGEDERGREKKERGREGDTGGRVLRGRDGGREGRKKRKDMRRDRKTDVGRKRFISSRGR